MQTTEKPTFQEYITSSELPVLVDFYADWCGPCKAVAPILHELSQEWSGKAKIIKVDTDRQQNLAMQYQIRSIPTLILFKNGKEVHRMMGAGGKDHLKAEFEKFF